MANTGGTHPVFIPELGDEADIQEALARFWLGHDQPEVTSGVLPFIVSLEDRATALESRIPYTSNVAIGNVNTAYLKGSKLFIVNDGGTKQIKINPDSMSATQVTTLNVPSTVGTSDDLVTRTATQTITAKTLTAPTISGGTINSATIGASSPSTGAFTTLSASSSVTATSTTDSTSTGSGAVVVSGGIGVAKAVYIGTTLNVAGASTLNSLAVTNGVTVGTTLGVTGTATFGTLNSSTTEISGVLSATNTTDVNLTTPASTGGIVTSGGVNIAKNLYVGVNAKVAGTFAVTGATTFSNSVTFAGSTNVDASGNITASGKTVTAGTLVTGDFTMSGTMQYGHADIYTGTGTLTANVASAIDPGFSGNSYRSFEYNVMIRANDGTETYSGKLAGSHNGVSNSVNWVQYADVTTNATFVPTYTVTGTWPSIQFNANVNKTSTIKVFRVAIKE